MQNFGTIEHTNVAYERQAAALRKNIDRHFGGMVEGFDTYRY